MDKGLIEKLEQERVNLLRYYRWQIAWGVVFLILVFISSFVLGSRTEQFWIYVIIPLIVAGSFWIYMQSTLKNVTLKYNQRVFEMIKPLYFPQWQFYPVFKLERQVFKSAGFLADFVVFETRNGLIGQINGQNVVISYVAVQGAQHSDPKQVFLFNGLFITMEQKFSLPVFGVFPKHKALERIKQKYDLIEIPTKLDADFNVLAQNEDVLDTIETLGPIILKYSHLCTEPEDFYFTTFGRRINIGLSDAKDIVQMDLKQPVTEQLIEQQIERLNACLEFLEELSKRVKLFYE